MASERESAREGESDPDRREAAVSAGMQAHLRSTAAGDTGETAFAMALGKAIERYLESLGPEERLRLLVGLQLPGVPIPEERMLPEDPEERDRALQAARRMAADGTIRRVRDSGDPAGRVYWLRQDRPDDPTRGQPDR